MKQFIILIGDIVILYLSLWLTLIIRYRDGYSSELWQLHFWPFTVVFSVWLVVFFIIDLYNIHTARNSLRFFTLLTKGLLINAVLALAFFYLAPGNLIDVRPKTNLLLNLAIVGVLFTIWRHVFNMIANTGTFAQQIFVIGANDRTQDLITEIENHPQLGYRVAGVVEDKENASMDDFIIPIIKKSEWLDEAERRGVRTLITTVNPQTRPEIAAQLLSAVRRKMEIFSFHSFYEKITGKIHVASIDQMWFLDNLSEGTKRTYDIISRFVDILLSIILLIIAIPFVPFIWMLIKIDDPGTSFFMQYRVGRAGRKFMAIKFRSMKQNAEANGPQWAVQNDPRVTRVGKFLRKTRIDEIPQLVNILKGEMSFVGPRPERPEFVSKLKDTIPFYNERHIVKPGLTGWAQINFPYGASENDALLKLQYDLYYVKNRSLILDVSILLKTIRIILSGSGI